MKLTLVNGDDQELLSIVNERVDGKGKEVVWFDWKPSTVYSGYIKNQVEQMKRCYEQKIPVIVFDRHSSMTDDEVVFLHKRTKALLFEPSINTRPGFRFMPYWIHFKDYKWTDFQDNRRFQTGFKGDVFTPDLESTILSVIKDKLSVGLDVRLPADKYNVLKSVVCIDKFEYEDLATMIITGSQSDYERGTLPDIRWIMYSGTVPCLYHKHKWLHSLFKNFIVYNNDDIRWLAKLYKTCHIGFIEDMQKNIKEYLPEMEASNWVDNLIEQAEKL